MKVPASFTVHFASHPSRIVTRLDLRAALFGLVLFAILAVAPSGWTQTVNRISQAVNPSKVQALSNHLPHWANTTNSAGLVPRDLVMDQMTIVLARSPDQQSAFEAFLADQQDPSSPNYHYWLTAQEVGDRFGLSEQDIEVIAAWLQSQGLHVNWISPSRTLIGFGGVAGDVGRAFQSEVNYYKVNGIQRMSVSSDPVIPDALAPVIKAIRGLYSTDERPAIHMKTAQSSSPQYSLSTGGHLISPADFATIYDVPPSLTGANQTIGILSLSRTNFADFANFRVQTGSTFPDPIETIPTVFGGVDPGINAFGQDEATLDVTRAGSVAPGARLLLVVSMNLDADAEYLVYTDPVPAQVMSISFQNCELNAGQAGVDFWDELFHDAVVEGISVFVSSGDSGSSDCESSFKPPDPNLYSRSPNSLCSSSYVTCVGGTEFNDTNNPSTYWSSSNTGSLSARGYIPEGAWNEPLSNNSTIQVAATGGGVSAFITPTPTWQTGTGVPAARTGRYTPDISFSAAFHDG